MSEMQDGAMWFNTSEPEHMNVSGNVPFYRE